MSASAPEVISKPQRLQDVFHTGPHDDTGADLSKAARAFVNVDVEGFTTLAEGYRQYEAADTSATVEIDVSSERKRSTPGKEGKYSHDGDSCLL